jgi:PhnB protein
MARAVKPVPEDFHTITPHLVVRGVARAIDFYRRAFGAHELLRNLAPDGEAIMHAELLLGDSRYFVNDEFPAHGVLSPLALGGSPVTLHLYVEDVDATFQQAVAAGAAIVMPVDNCFWGDRYGIVKDPFGHVWSIGSRIEDLSPEELHERAKTYSQTHDWGEPSGRGEPA